MSFKVVIPARFASTRLPAKPLIDLGGRPMVVRVAEAAARSGADEVVVATDHQQIAQAASAYGVAVEMTAEDHPSGTDRIAEVCRLRGWSESTIVVNVQGDEPLIDPQLINRLALELADSEAAMATAAHPLTDAEAFFSPNVVKVVRSAAGDAHYFSRAPLPWARDALAKDKTVLPENLGALRHIGIYAYRVAFLHAYCSLPPSPLEQWEALEQLRALWHGYRIQVAVEDHPPAPGVDTPEDVERVRKAFDPSSVCR